MFEGEAREFGMVLTDDGYALVTWYDSYGEKATAELNPESPDVKECIALLRKIIWGD